MGYTVAVVGATGAVGTRMIQQLEQYLRHRKNLQWSIQL